MKILITEDDREYRSILYAFLHSKGHDVLAASDALHAVALLSDDTHGIDLVLLDINMPRLRGDDLLQSFDYWSTSHTRFLIVSGCANLERFATHPKVAGCLQKPFGLSELETLVNREQALRKSGEKPALAAS